MPRRRYPNISKGTDGLYHAWVTVGTKPNGRPDQRHVKRDTIKAVEARIDELLDQVRGGSVVKSGRSPTVEKWMEQTYFETIAARRCDPTTIQGYRSKMRSYVYPVIGGMRIDRVQPDNLDAIYLAMSRAGLADSTILQVHRILHRAFKVAHRRKVVASNPAALIDSPTAKRPEMNALTLDDAGRVLAAAAGRRNRARWSVGLALGLRQGEALGLRWEYLDLDAATMRVWWQLHRRAFEHGCGGTCGRRRGGNCPARVLRMRSGEIQVTGGLVLKEPKGKSRRTVPVPAELVAQLRQHREVQDLEKMVAGDAYAAHGFVFAQPDGCPVDPSSDWQEWKDLLAEAKVPDARVHDGRHTAGTLLLAQGVNIRVVQEILGHSSVKVTEGYAHVASAMAADAAAKMGRALFGSD